MGLEVKKQNKQQNKRQNKKPEGSCSCCGWYAYDDEGGFYVCTAPLDEDEMERFLSYSVKGCPYFQIEDEYKLVRSQK